MAYTNGMFREDALKDKVILVTGGGTGLGRSMSRYFLTLGAKVVICSRKKEVIETAAAELSAETGGEALGLVCDVRDYAQVETVLATILAKFGRIDGLVNNAAGNFLSPTERLSHRAIDIVVDIVLRGSYNMTLCLGKHWIAEKQPATVLSIVTTYAWTGSAFVVPSAMAKAGVLAMTRSLAVEWAKYGIRMNAIAPGPFPTEGAWQRLFPADAFPPHLQEHFADYGKVPIKRVGHHQELANLSAYLMSNFSAFVNGEVITIDGGEWLNGAGEFNHLNILDDATWDEIGKKVREK